VKEALKAAVFHSFVLILAAFAAAVKIDTFAYLPVQDFGNAFSTFVAQNYGAGNKDRIRLASCCFGIPVLKLYRRDRNLDLDSDRMDSCRYCRDFVHVC